MSAPRMASLGVVGLVATGYALAFGALLWWRLRGDFVDGVLCAGPGMVAIPLSLTSQSDRQQYVVRLLAAAMFLPLLLLMWASSHERGGLWLLLFAVGHTAAFLAMITWLASYATRIWPAPGLATVGSEALRRRIALLVGAIPQAVLHDLGPAYLLIDRRREVGDRTHRVALQIDERRRQVTVREFLGAAGADPDARERDMRIAGEPWFDPSRPEAQAIWSRTWQTTMIVPERLAQAALQIELDHARPPTGTAPPMDGESLVTLLAALVTRSGYAWLPRLLPTRGGRPG